MTDGRIAKGDRVEIAAGEPGAKARVRGTVASINARTARVLFDGTPRASAVDRKLLRRVQAEGEESVAIEAVAYHRNGIGGAGFHVVTFTDSEAELGPIHGAAMVGIVFEEEGRVAVFDRVLLGKGEIGFGVNSWRGDHYEPILRRAIRVSGEKEETR